MSPRNPHSPWAPKAVKHNPAARIVKRETFDSPLSKPHDAGMRLIFETNICVNSVTIKPTSISIKCRDISTSFHYHQNNQSIYQSIITINMKFSIAALLFTTVLAEPVFRPTGKHAVGTTSFPLVDESRDDPFAPKKPAKREILVKLYYPTAADNKQLKEAPYANPEEMEVIKTGLMQLPKDMKTPDLMTNFLVDAPIDMVDGMKVVMFSHGYGGFGTLYQAMCSELASHGNLVASMTHTYDALIAAFPDGRNIRNTLQFPPPGDGGPNDYTLEPTRVRQADSLFLLKTLSDRKMMHKLVPGLDKNSGGKCLDVQQVGMFGHSLGGATTATAMFNEPRIACGMDLDGTFQNGTDYSNDLKRPFYILEEENHDARKIDATYVEFLGKQTGDVRRGKMMGTTHMTFTDGPAMVKSLDPEGKIPKEKTTPLTGTNDPKKTTEIMNKVIVDFFNHHLKGIKEKGALEGAVGTSAMYPDILKYVK